MICEQRLEGNTQTNHEHIWGQNMAGIENNESKDPEEGLNLEKLGTASLVWLKGTEP